MKLEITDLMLIIAPRHPERAQSISNIALKKGFIDKNIKFLSKNEEVSGETELIIYDKIGELGELYTIADSVILGGAFKNYGAVSYTHLTLPTNREV